MTVEATTSATAAVDVFDSTSTAKSLSRATAAIPLTVDAPGGIALNIMGIAGPVSGTAAPGFSDYPGNTASASGSINVPTGDFSSFIGTVPSRYSADFSSSTFTGTSAPGVFFGGSALAGGTTTVTYTAASPTPSRASVPEPMSMALFGSGSLFHGHAGLQAREDVGASPRNLLPAIAIYRAGQGALGQASTAKALIRCVLARSVLKMTLAGSVTA